MNKVTMVVTDTKVGYCFLRNCADVTDKSLYLVPTYLMELKWTKDGKQHKCTYEVVRFGLEVKDGKTVVDGIRQLEETKIQTWFDLETIYPYDGDGAWKIKNNYLVHSGPDDPRWFHAENTEYPAICSTGCVLVGRPEQWADLNNKIREAAGVPNHGYAAGKNGNLWIEFEQVTDEDFPGKVYEIEKWRNENNEINLTAVLSKLGEFLRETYGKDPGVFKPKCEIIPVPDRVSWNAAAGAGSPARRDPLVLDLNGDGIKTVNLQEGAYFDHNADGFAEQTSWVGPDDGLLVMDWNGNGFIDDGRELFGNGTVLSNGKLASNGFEALAAFDCNADGKIDSADPIFSQLLVWRDWDSNGYSSDYELVSLDEVGIKSINLQSAMTQITDEQGNTQNRLGSFQWAGGTTGQIGEYTFQQDTMYTAATDPLDVPSHISALPDLKGYGNVHDLQQAMVRDTSGQLESLVNQFLAATDVSERNSLTDRILFQWTGSENIDPTSRGKFIDARKLAVLEAFFGHAFVGVAGPNPTETGAALLQESYYRLFELTYSQLMYQTHLKDLFDMVWCGRCEETNSLAADMTVVIEELNHRLAADPVAGTTVLSEFARSLRALQVLDTAEYLAFREAFIQQDPSLGWIFDTGGLPVYNQLGQSPDGWYYPHMFGTWGSDAVKGSLTAGDGVINGLSGDDVIYGTARNELIYHSDGDALIVAGGGRDTIWAGAGNDILDGGEGSDTLRGETGSDTYILRVGSGRDTIIETDRTAGNVDTIWIGSFLTPDDIAVKRSGNDLVVKIIGTDDTMTVKQFFDQASVSFHSVEQIQFADGTVWDLDEILRREGQPTQSDDYLVGTAEDDTIDALGGNDTVIGQAGSDTLNGGAGNDILIGEAGSDTLNGGTGDDRLSGGPGSDRYMFAQGDGRDTVIDTDTTPGNVDTVI
ncbi:MAG: calcium-binding protein, partial [Thermodesulfobacteriota bacterium]